MDIFISLTRNVHSIAVVSIRYSEGVADFPLTKRGCIAAGKFLSEIKAESWMFSSSVDFPKEVKPSFRHNVLDLIDQGFNSVAFER